MSIIGKIKLIQKQPSKFVFIPFKNALQPYLVLILVSVLVYINTLNNEVAYDDEIVLHKNEYVQQGIKGIPGIISHDSYYSYYKQLGMENVLPAGRYRPMSFITFAVEQEFIGTLPDGIVKQDSWDTNKNKIKDSKEDTNKDGLFTDYDYWIKGSSFRHFVNVLLYAFCILLIYYVLITYVFVHARDMVFCALLLFAIHPLHTEVVANIKSRDEILSLIFVFTSLLFSLSYLKNNSNKYLVYLLISMFCALLSKEYALFLFAFIPAVIYVFHNDKINLKENNFWIVTLLLIISSFSLIKFFNTGTLIAVPLLFIYLGYFFSKKSSQAVTKIVFALGTALILYLSLRFSATQHQVKISSFEADIISNPYMFATPDQIWASKIAIWLKYLKLFFVPDPLLVDYSFKTIPYSSFSSPEVWFSILIYATLVFVAIYTFIKRNKFAFALLFILGFFLPVANVLIDIGATMGERLFFHSSLGLSILIMMLFFKFIEKISATKKVIVWLLLGVFFIQNSLYAFLTIKRNPDWKNNSTLFTHDINYAPDNLNLIFGASSSYYQMAFQPINKEKRFEYLKKSNELANHGIKIYPKHDQLYFNKALNFFALNELDSCLANTQFVTKMSPFLPNLIKFKSKLSNEFMLMGIKSFQKNDSINGLLNLSKAVIADSTNIKALNNNGKAYFDIGNFEKALLCFNTTLKLNPDNKIALNAVSAIRQKLGIKQKDLKKIMDELNNDRKNDSKWYELGTALLEAGSVEKSKACFQTALSLNPNNIEAKQALEKITNR